MARHHNPELIRDAIFARCKLLWGVGLVVKFLVFALGIFVVFALADEKIIALIGLFLVATSELLLWLSDRWKSAAQELHRKLDLENSFGWHITQSEILDFLARYPGDINSLAGEATGSYFASKECPGSKRAVENLRESAWWSMHLAESMWWIFVSAIVAIFFGCIVLLNVSIENVSQAPAQATSSQAQAAAASGVVSPVVSKAVSAGVVKVVTSAILFVFSYGLFRFAVGYYSFSAKSKQIKEKAELLLESGSADQIQAVKLWQDYHLAREAAPLLPTWIWKLRQKKLNALWRAYVSPCQLK